MTLRSCCLSFVLTLTCLAVFGDCNIHVDNTKDSSARELHHTIDHFGLTQHVSGPTHCKGHTLDLVMSKGLNISKVLVTDVALSDHYCDFF